MGRVGDVEGEASTVVDVMKNSSLSAVGWQVVEEDVLLLEPDETVFDTLEQPISVDVDPVGFN